MKILLVEDDTTLARGLQALLLRDGYDVVWADSLKAAFAVNESEDLRLVLLDLGLADGSGFDFLKRIKDSNSRLPVIILSGRADEDSVVEGLQRGANDYVRKPFGSRELSARIKTVLREPQLRENQIRYGELLLLLDQRIVMFGNVSVELKRREFDILRILIERADAIVSRELIMNSLDAGGEIYDRTIDSHVSHLRARLRKAGVVGLKISSVYGLGYRLECA